MEKIIAVLSWIKARLKEPSTLKGIAAALGALGVSMHPELITEIATAAVAVIGIVEIVRREDAGK